MSNARFPGLDIGKVVVSSLSFPGLFQFILLQRNHRMALSYPSQCTNALPVITHCCRITGIRDYQFWKGLYTMAPLMFVSLLLLTSCISQKRLINPAKIAWIHGSADCQHHADPPIQLVQLNSSTWILRQNKCINYEAPFLFLFLGDKKALLMDTGATEDSTQFPLYQTVRKLVDQWEQARSHNVELLVAHTHAHGDHIAADTQFINKPKTTVVGKTVSEVASFFNIQTWPSTNGAIDLGNRLIDVIPIPGHDKSSIALYDHQTKLLLSGDSVYPGRLYIRDWQAYTLSMQRLTDFVRNYRVSYILGNHIEMTKTPGLDYATGTTFQPDEQILPLQPTDLVLLNETLKNSGSIPRRVVLDKFIITPLKPN
jgi:hydroxyacylglutathione hydrolase